MPNVLRQNQLTALVRKGFLAAKYPAKHGVARTSDAALIAIELKLKALILDAESPGLQDDELLRRQGEIYLALQNYIQPVTTAIYRAAQDDQFHQYAEALQTKSFERLMNDYVTAFVEIYIALHEDAAKEHAVQIAINTYNDALAEADSGRPFGSILETKLRYALNVERVKKNVLSNATKRMFQSCLNAVILLVAVGSLVATFMSIAFVSPAMLAIMLSVSLLSIMCAMVYVVVASEHHKKEMDIETKPLYAMEACKVSMKEAEHAQLFSQISRTTFNLAHLKWLHAHLSAKIRHVRATPSNVHAEASSSTYSYENASFFSYDDSPAYEYSSNHHHSHDDSSFSHYHSHDDSSNHYHSHDDSSSYHHGHG